jgi:hypothetical protein
MADGTVGVAQLPKARLNPAEAASLDVDGAIKGEIRSKKIAAASIKFDYTTAPGSVVMAAESVSTDRNLVFRVPMWDVPAQRNGTGGYPGSGCSFARPFSSSPRSARLHNSTR